MKKVLLVLVLIFVFTSSGCKQDEIVDEQKEVVFDESLDLNTMIVTVDENNDEYNITGEIIYHAVDDLSELYLMMYPNTHTTGEQRVTLNSLTISGEEVQSLFEGEDNSALHVTLNTPIYKDDAVVITYNMDVVYPDSFRLAHYGDILYQMYFYPYVAMYDDGFDIDPYSTKGESYYNVLSNYDVTIVLDSGFIVSAPGTHISSEEDGTITSHRYKLKNAMDFSFSASKNYEVYQWEEEGMEYEIYSIRQLSDTELSNTKEYMRKSFEVYETYIGDYYYDRFVLELGYIYGMESSGIIYCSEEISEGTIVHEIIHQWFFFMIGNDPYDESFLDESLVTYIASLYYYDLYGMEGYNGYLDYRNSSKPEFDEHWTLYGGDSLLDTPDQMGDGYAFIIYYHGPSLFREYVYTYLDNDVEEFSRILSVYYDQYEGNIATIDGFLTLLEEQSGVAITKEWFYFHMNSLQDVSNSP